MRWRTVFRVILAGCVFIVTAAKAQEEELDYSWAPQMQGVVTSRASSSSCITVNFNPGTCVPVPRCPAAVNILRRGSLSAKNRQILQRSLCDASYDKHPVVCCTRPSSPRTANETPVRQPPADPLPTPTRRPPTRQPAPDPLPREDPLPPPTRRPPTRRPPPDPLPRDDPLPPSTDNSLENHENARLIPMNDCGKSLDGKLFGGEEASLYDFPWMALLKYRIHNSEGFHCGGTLINNRYVLTAAHCVDSQLPAHVRLISIRVGEHNIKTNPDCKTIKTSGKSICAPPFQEISVADSMAHPQYDSREKRRRYNDVALVRLQRPAQFHDYVQPICLPFGSVGEQDLVNRRLFVSGWGKTETRPGSDVKQKVILPVTGERQCSSVFQQLSVVIDYNQQICAGGETGKDSCNGDSGGPLMGVKSGSWYQYGIVSFGNDNCGSTGWPGVYTRVSTHLKWILDNISE